MALDDRRRHFNLLDLLTRREEAYHDKLRQVAESRSGETRGGGAVSIHDLVAVKEPGLERRLVYDAYRRGSCIDHALPPEATFDSFERAILPELADLPGRPYAWRIESGVLCLERTAPLGRSAVPDQIGRAHV